MQPPTLSAENGFATAQRPPAPWFNWQLNAIGSWIDFLRSPNVEQFTRTSWATSPGSYDSSSPVLLAVDATTLDATGAAYRMVIAGWETSGPTTSLHVSQTGNAWTRRTNLPGGMSKPTALAHLNNAARWILADDTPALWYAPHDAGAGTSPVGGSSSGWVSCSGTSDDGSGGLTAFKAIASNTSQALAITAAGGLSSADGVTWAAIIEGTARSGNGLDVVWDGANFVYITSDGEVYASPTADGSFALKSTLSAADWRLAAGDTGEVIAYQRNNGSVTDLQRSTNSGTSFTALTPVSADGRDVARLTCLRWRDGVWMATSSVAPFLWTSNNGTSWHALRPQVSGAGALAAIAWDGRAWIAAGNGWVVQCPPGADPATGDYVADDAAATLADAGTLRGRRITTGAPSNGDTLVWDAGTSTWVYGAGGGGSLPVADPADLIAGATASRLVGTDVSGDGTLLTAAQGRTLLGVVDLPITTQGDLAVGDATGAPVRLAKGAEGKVLRAGATTVMWDDPPAPSGVAMLNAANVFTDLQTLSTSSSTWGTPIPVAAFRHNNGGGSSWQGVAVRFEVKNDGSPARPYGYVVARAYGSGNDANDNLVEMRPAFSAGDPPVGLRVRCNVASAIWGVELLLAAGGGSPTFQPCRESGSGDVDLTLQGLGAGVVRLPAATGYVGTVAEINALTRPVGVMAFATNASGGPKPCWSTGSAWVLADGSALS